MRHYITDEQKAWCDTIRLTMREAPDRRPRRPFNDPMRRQVYDFVTKPRFDGFIMICIVFNTVTMVGRRKLTLD